VARDFEWHHTVRRPASIAELVEAVRVALPLPAEGRRPLD
jgi:hypothetical protein